jgi:tetratricopeptide (TPR) repeat protein
MPAGPGPRPSLIAVLLTVWPGLGHWWLGRARRGYLFFVTSTFFGNLALLSLIAPLPPLGDWSLHAGLAGAAGTVLYAFVDILRIGVYARWPSVRERRQRRLTEAAEREDAGRVHEAREIWDRLLDVDPADPEVRLALARSYRRSGDSARALHHARRALRALPRSPVRDELLRELELAREGLRVA